MAGIDPYANHKFKANPFSKKRDVAGELVAILNGKMPDRGLELIQPISRCIKKDDVHELIMTNEHCGPGSTVNNIAYVGFVRIVTGGVVIQGDEVYVNEQLLGMIAGFDETHMPNHQNIIIAAHSLYTGQELGFEPGMPVTIKMIRKEV